MNSPEFAETYSRGERVRYVLKGLVLGSIGLVVWKLWLLPWITHFADTAPCRTVFGLKGTDVLWLGVCAGLPMLFAVLVALVQGRAGLAVLRDGQYPPRGVKVFQAIRVRRGAAARWIGYAHILAFVPFIAIAIWGYGQAVTLSQLKGTTRCPGQPATKLTALADRGMALP